MQLWQLPKHEYDRSVKMEKYVTCKADVDSDDDAQLDHLFFIKKKWEELLELQ